MTARVASVSLLVIALLGCLALAVVWQPNGHIQERHPETVTMFARYQPADASRCYSLPAADRKMLIFDTNDPCREDDKSLVWVVFTTISGAIVTGLFMARRRAMRIVERDGYREDTR